MIVEIIHMQKDGPFQCLCIITATHIGIWLMVGPTNAWKHTNIQIYVILLTQKLYPIRHGLSNVVLEQLHTSLTNNMLETGYGCGFLRGGFPLNILLILCCAQYSNIQYCACINLRSLKYSCTPVQQTICWILDSAVVFSEVAFPWTYLRSYVALSVIFYSTG